MESRSELRIVDVRAPQETPGEDDTRFAGGQLDLDRSTITAREVLGSLETTDGWAEVAALIPGLRDQALYMEVAYFTPCEKRGTGTSLRVAGEPGGRVSSSGIVFTQTHPNSSRVELAFWTGSGPHVLTMRAMNWAGPYKAKVDTSIDGISLDQVELYGPTTRSFVVNLSGGSHVFTIREVHDVEWAPWVFQSFAVTAIPVVKEFAPN